MNIRIAERIKRLPPSATLALNARVKQLRAEGIDVLNFSVGEPDFDTPARVGEAAARAIKAGHTRYTDVKGILALREAIVARILSDYGVSFQPDEVLVSCGGKHSLYNLFQTLLGPGDEVLIPAPHWLTYPPQVALAEGRPVIIPSSFEEGFELNLERLKEACTKQTRAIILNSPSNPTGMVYEEETLHGVAELAVQRDLVIITDDLYYRLMYGRQGFRSILALHPELKERTVVIGGVSKTYAMTGWRVGWALGPPPLIKAMATLQGQSTSNACSIAQMAALEAVSGAEGDREIEIMRAAFSERREAILAGLGQMPGVRCLPPQGAFYVFPDLSSFYGRTTPGGDRITGSLSMAAYLVEHARFAGVPGVVFGDDRHMRLSYACGLEQIEEGMARLADALDKLS